MKLWHFILLTLINFSALAETVPEFNEMEFFDRALIVNSKISKLSLTISTTATNTHKTEEDSISCIVFTSQFDRKGNPVLYDLNRVASYNYNTYDNSGKLIDWGWEDKSSGVKTSLAQAYKEEGNYFEQLAAKETYLMNDLSSKLDYRKKVVRHFYDPCFNIDSDYEVMHTDSGALPRKAIAKRILNFNSDFLKNILSPRKLFITYDYTFYE